jgi:hypothetical protein
MVGVLHLLVISDIFTLKRPVPRSTDQYNRFIFKNLPNCLPYAIAFDRMGPGRKRQ